MRKVIIFGCGKIGYAVRSYIEEWQSFDVAAHVLDRAFVDGPFHGRDVVALDEVAERFPPSDHGAFVAVGYQRLNALRAEKMAALAELGYDLVNVVNPRAPRDLKVGCNCFVAAGETVQPAVTCGNGVFVWNGALIGHNAVLSDHAWVTGGASIGGNATIGASSFVGLGAVVSHDVVVGEGCVLGAASHCAKDVADKTVLIAPETPAFRLNSDQFVKFSSMFRE